MVFNLIFYRSYLFFAKQKFRKDPVIKASGMIGGIILLNVFTIMSLIKSYIVDYAVNEFQFIIITIIVVLVAMKLYNEKKLKKINNKYSKYPNQRLRTLTIFSGIYAVISIIMFFAFMVNLTT